MRYTRDRFTLLWFPGWFGDAFKLRRHPLGQLWLWYRWRYRKAGDGTWELHLGPITICWGNFKWMA